MLMIALAISFAILLPTILLIWNHCCCVSHTFLFRTRTYVGMTQRIQATIIYEREEILRVRICKETQAQHLSRHHA